MQELFFECLGIDFVMFAGLFFWGPEFYPLYLGRGEEAHNFLNFNPFW
jgi:hypothetical protein